MLTWGSIRPAGNVEAQYAQEVGREIRTITVYGGGEAAGYIKYIYQKMNGAERRNWSWWGAGVVGVAMLVGFCSS